jgi:hypothetical protein
MGIPIFGRKRRQIAVKSVICIVTMLAIGKKRAFWRYVLLVSVCFVRRLVPCSSR